MQGCLDAPSTPRLAGWLPGLHVGRKPNPRVDRKPGPRVHRNHDPRCRTQLVQTLPCGFTQMCAESQTRNANVGRKPNPTCRTQRLPYKVFKCGPLRFTHPNVTPSIMYHVIPNAYSNLPNCDISPAKAHWRPTCQATHINEHHACIQAPTHSKHTAMYTTQLQHHIQTPSSSQQHLS